MKFTSALAFSMLLILNISNSQIINRWNGIYSEVGSFTTWWRNNNLQCFDKDNVLLIDQKFLNTSPFLAGTTNGGITWDTLFRSNSFEYEINAIAYPSINNMVWVGDTTEFQKMDDNFNEYYLRSGVIFTSTNAGKDWTKLKLDTNTLLNYVVMLNETTGIINQRLLGNYYNENISYWDTLLYTTDFFKTYTKIPVPDEMNFVEKIYMFDENNFMIQTTNHVKKSYKFLETTDKGATWTEFADAGMTMDLYFVDRQNAYKIDYESTATPNVYKSNIFRTSDGGKNWSYCFTPEDMYWKDYTVYRIAAADYDNAYAVGSNGAIYRTEDGGKSWTKEFVPSDFGGWALEYDNLSYVAYPEVNTAYTMGGMSGALFKMENEKILTRPLLYKYSGRISPIGIKAHWKPVEGAAKYRFQLAYSDDNVYNIDKFDNLTLDTLVSDTLLILPDVKYNSCYYARAKAINDEMESEWCIRAAMFCTLQSAEYTTPPAFIDPLPAAVITSTSHKFIWSSVPGAVEYQFEIADNPYYQGQVIHKYTNLTDTTAVNDYLVFGNTYYARVRVTKGDKITEWGSTYFYVKDPSGIDENSGSGDFIISQSDNYIQIFSNSFGENQIIEIYDMLGVKVISEPIHQMTSSHRMNIENLPAGVYFVKIGDRVEKFVKM